MLLLSHPRIRVSADKSIYPLPLSTVPTPHLSRLSLVRSLMARVHLYSFAIVRHVFGRSSRSQPMPSPCFPPSSVIGSRWLFRCDSSDRSAEEKIFLPYYPSRSSGRLNAELRHADIAQKRQPITTPSHAALHKPEKQSLPHLYSLSVEAYGGPASGRSKWTSRRERVKPRKRFALTGNR